MPTFFDTIFPDEIKMPVSNIQVLLDSYRERQKTGIIRLGYAGEKQMCFLIKRGEIVNTYLVTPEKWEEMSPEHSADWMSSAGDAYTRSMPLSAFGLLMTKLLIQSRSDVKQVITHHTPLSEYLASASGKDTVSLVHLAWKNAASAILFIPHSDPHFNFISQDIILDETGSYKALCEWNEPQCAVTTFSPDSSTEAWQEYYLRNAFASIYETSLARFEVLTGRALVDSLVRLVNVFTSRQNMEITVTARKLMDNEVFSSPRQALYAYRLLLAELFNHFSAVIGARLYVSTLREIVKKLPEQEQKVALDFELLPKGYFYE